MGRIAELEQYIENLQAKIHNMEYERDDLRNLLQEVIDYHDDTLPRIRKQLEK